MGYPMTFKRLVNRNRLEGDYGTKMTGINTRPWDRIFLDSFQSDVDRIDVLLDHAAALSRELESLNQRWGAVMGDLRRLEKDAVDEQALCQQIASRTGVDRDLVAIVLKEFFSW